MRLWRSPWLPAALMAAGVLALAFGAYRDPSMELLLAAYRFCAG